MKVKVEHQIFMATSMLLRSLWKREFHSSSLAAVRTVSLSFYFKFQFYFICLLLRFVVAYRYLWLLAVRIDIILHCRLNIL